MRKLFLIIDQGTSSTRVVLFDNHGEILDIASLEFKQYYPHKSWVEHDPKEILSDTLKLCNKIINNNQNLVKDIASIGITNQRETTIIWDRETGNAIYPAIVWQDRRTADFCKNLDQQGVGKVIFEKTGLLLDPYFSASKINWILDNVENARERAVKGELAFGTIDSFLLWHLTGGKSHATDVTNASRTMLYNIYDLCWDDELLKLFNIPKAILPEVKPTVSNFGVCNKDLFGASLSICALVGDQQAATFGQSCLRPGMVKSTYGTGCFVMLNTGETPVKSSNKLLTTICYQVDNKPIYALEGSIFMAGAIVTWLKDNMGLIATPEESEVAANNVQDNNGVYLIPAFTGLGAPYWRADVKAAIMGLTRDSNKNHIIRAGLESVAFQTYDLLQAMEEDMGAKISLLRVDGKMINNNWLMQFLANLLNLPIQSAKIAETTSLGAAFLAGLGCGVFKSYDEIELSTKANKKYLPKQGFNSYNCAYETWLEYLESILK